SVKSFDDMQSDYSSIQGQWVWSRAATHAPHTPGSAARAIDTACFSAKQCTNRLYTNTLGRNRMSGQPDQVIEVHSEQSNTGKWILLFLALLYVAGSLYFLFDLRGRSERMAKDLAVSETQIAELTKRMQSAEAEAETLGQQVGLTKRD